MNSSFTGAGKDKLTQQSETDPYVKIDGLKKTANIYAPEILHLHLT
jgi:hypothetical protein